MKRSNPSSGRKTHIPSDFKRLKAKVGKRAPQKANVTETKFKTASVQVKSQTINATTDPDNDEALNRKEIITSKGKHLSQLLAQLNHPSPSVRISSLQGMKDATKSTPDAVIFNHLAALIPSLSKSMVDDDFKVRKLARIIFQDVIIRIGTNHAKEKMIPFLPLSLAYVASALHSLDQDVRYDGSIALEIVCTHFRSELKKEKEVRSLLTTIPSYVTLFDDVSGGVASVARRGIGDIGSTSISNAKNTSKKKQKSKSGAKSKTSEKSISILRSFIAVLKATTLRGNDEVDVDKAWSLNDDTMKRLHPNGATLLPSLNKPNLRFLHGGVASNAIVWKNDSMKSICKYNCKSIYDLGSIANKINQLKSKTQSEKAINIKTQIDLLSRLRNRIVELSQEGNYEDGLSISSNHIHDLSLLVASLRLLWNCHPRYFDKEDEAKIKFVSYDGKTNEWKKFKKTANLLLKLLIETFPVRDPSGNAANNHKYNLLNASLCCAISELGSVLDQSSNNRDDTKVQSQWVDHIFSYLLPKLREDNSDVHKETMERNKPNSKVTLMKVVEQLLLRHESGVYFLENKTKHLELISTFASVFFSDRIKPTESLCRSLEGRRAVYILLALISEHYRGAWVEHLSEYWNVLSNMATSLPLYLIMWRDSYQKESSLVLSTLLSIARRHNATSTDDTSNLSSFCFTIRDSLMDLFASDQDLSVFEGYTSLSTQKLAISIMGVLQNPSDQLVSSFAQICSRFHSNNEANLDQDIVDDIMNVMYTIRSTVGFESYVSFLIESTNLNMYIGKVQDETEEICNNSSCFHDLALAMSSRYMCLLLNEDERIISILTPKFIQWLEESSKLDGLLKARAAIIYIVCWSIHYTQNQKCYFTLSPVLKTSISNAITDSFLTSSDLFKHKNLQTILPILVS